MIIDRLLWIPKDEVNVSYLKKILIVTPKSYMEEAESLQLWEEKTIDGIDYLGVPRQFGNYLDGSAIDCTVFNAMTWPSFLGDYRKGQQESITKIYNFLRSSLEQGALLQAAPGFGKTLLGCSIASCFDARALVLIHKDDLAKQWHNTGRNFFSIRLGHVQQDHWDYKDKHLVTATVQTLYRRRNKLPKDFWQQFGMLIVDEGHHTPAKSFEYVIRQCPARYRLGLSATFRRKDGMECIWKWHIGKIRHVMKGERLTGEYIQIPIRTPVEADGHSSLITVISENKEYNRWLRDQVIAAASAGRKVLVVSDRVKQLKKLQDLISKSYSGSAGLYVGSLNGKTLTQKELKEAAKCDIILGTYGKIGEGTDIPELDTLYLVTPRSDIEQCIGRIQRVCEKKKLLIIDPVFNNIYLRNLAVKREKMYKKLGFVKQK